MQMFTAQFLFQSLFSDKYGKVISRRPSMVGDEEESDRAKLHEMTTQCHRQQAFYALAAIVPAARRVVLEHRIELQTLRELVQASPFVPFDREDAFARGLLAGLRGDMATAIHLLVLQLENAFRTYFEQQGFPTSRVDKHGIQEDFDLNELLRSPVFPKLFGEDMTFNLRVMLVEKAGLNLRNNLAHGLMSDREMSSSTWNFLWWLVLRLCLEPFVQRNEANGPADAAEETQ